MLHGFSHVVGGRGLGTVAAWGLVLAWNLGAAGAYTPDNPVVKEMVQRATKLLETADSSEPGGKCLIGLALAKANYPPAHPKIRGAIKVAQELAAQVPKTGVGNHCYNVAVACIFLCEVAPDECRSEIQTFVAGLLQRQKPTGMWTYQAQDTNDTSQTQYGMLALWSAHSIGITVPVPALEAAVQWLLRTQSADGAFAYQAPDPGPGKTNGVLANVSHSMSAAGAGSLYLAAHILGGARQGKSQGARKEDKTLPPAVTRVAPEKGKGGFVVLQPQTISLAVLRRACAVSDQWFAKNFLIAKPNDQWTYYYLYGLERYKSFKETIEGEEEVEPAWYNAVVDYMREKQSATGAWQSSGYGEGVDTAFGVLCLVRSTRKAIKKASQEEGILIGGKGLPKDLANARLVDGKVVTPQMVKDVEDFLQLLKDTEHKEFDPLALAGNLSLDEDLTKRGSQLAKLRELVTAEDFGARLTAIRTLSRSGEFDSVPALIFALSDPDPTVVREAREGLRFISRKFEGVGPVPAKPTEQQLQTEQARWKDWFRSIRPDAEFLD